VGSASVTTKLVLELGGGTKNIMSKIADAFLTGFGDVLQHTFTLTGTSTTAQTALTPTSGSRIRIISAEVSAKLTTAPDRVGVYFGTGASYTSAVSKAICQGYIGTTGDFFRTWEDGAGPVGGIDDVVSIITETETETGLELTLVYREQL
jgi:hypothetical protein